MNKPSAQQWTEWMNTYGLVYHKIAINFNSFINHNNMCLYAKGILLNQLNHKHRSFWSEIDFTKKKKKEKWKNDGTIGRNIWLYVGKCQLKYAVIVVGCVVCLHQLE